MTRTSPHVVDRRSVLKGGTATLAALAAPGALAQPAIVTGVAKIVVIGGGPGGATVAGHLKRRYPALDVTLIEPQTLYTTCFFSNHYLGGFKSFGEITQNYRGLEALGVKVVHAAADAIDLAQKSVRVGAGDALAYDRLVVAPGIDFKFGSIEGYDEAATKAMPHAWKGGAQTRLLRLKFETMDDGGTVVIATPRNPYRCPPGPYERACIVADYLKREKPRSKLIVLDPKMAFSKQPVFEEAFAKYYPNLELHLTNDIDDQALARVDPATGEIETKAGLKITAAVANVIPDQRAGDIAAHSGLTDGDWCPVDFSSMRSTKDTSVYVIGDAARAAEMPKSAFTAHNHALMVVSDILAEIGAGTRGPARYRNTCWSMLAPADSVKIGADYTPGEIAGKPALVPVDPFVSKPGETAEQRRQNYDDSLAWYDTLTSDVFAKDIAHRRPE